MTLNRIATKYSYKVGIQWLAGSAAIALVTVAGWLTYTWTLNRPAASVSVRLVTVARDTVEEVINDSGTVELGNQQTLKAPADGTVEQIRVDVGDSVTSGQILVVLQDANRQTALAKQQLEIEKQQLQLSRSRQQQLEASQKLAATQDKLPELAAQEVEIRKLELQLTRNREKVKEQQQKQQSTQEELQQLEVLLEKGFIPENEVKQQQDQLLEVQSQLRDAELAVNTTTLDRQRLQVEYQSQRRLLLDQVQEARLQLQDAQLAASTELRELERLKLEKQKIQQEIQENYVKATIKGRILDIPVKVGDVVKLGDSLLTLGDPAREFVQLQLSSLDAARLKVNQVTRVRAIGPNAKTFTGRVQNISELASAAENSGQAKVTAKIELDQPSHSLIVGSQVDVEIILGVRPDVVAVNRDLIQGSGGDTFVWVQDSQGKAQKRSVKLGLEGLTAVEVTSGLRQGDRAIVPPVESPLQQGTPVVAED